MTKCLQRLFGLEEYFVMKWKLQSTLSLMSPGILASAKDPELIFVLSCLKLLMKEMPEIQVVV